MSILVTKTVEGGCRTILPFDELSLQDIPCLLKKMGWNTAANLMDHWFSTTPAFEMNDLLRDKYMVGKAIDIPKEHYNDSILKMAWAIRYKQVQDAIDVLLNEKLNNILSQKAIFSRLLERNKILSPLDNKKIPIGYCSNIIDIDYTSQVNWTQFGGHFDTVDELRAAIGAGNLELCIRGYYDLSGIRKAIIIDKIGFYIKDAYNFSGNFEPLGIWSHDGVLPFSQFYKYMALYTTGAWGSLYKQYKGYVPVFNRDFRRWQDENNEGGDFIVFSDVYWIDTPKNYQVIYENN
ncbi:MULTISPECIES: DUF6402 family protein [Enterobacterales]|uniref:DUF6402 family protein n=1 Tax=Enterobacterales TaxID=91347 RepID=UPI000847DAC8|nr:MULTISPECIES: DUF6402 family protein [Enterobacterales]ODQ08002.1 hypothetical protein BGK50_12860 [Shigella sp. FC130]OEI95562.1 hypothetical protein BHE86_11835 [Shigella sp. FC1655]WOO50679.1 DUF6402 family protein [Hafnia alvei]WPF05147.1 DUF6402 family protein [Proteus vulgaris]